MSIEGRLFGVLARADAAADAVVKTVAEAATENPADPAVDNPCTIRMADPAVIGRALRASRAHTLGVFACYERALGPAAMAVPYSTEINPPLWELGHIAWFQEYWISRNPQIRLGIGADSDAPRAPSLRPDADRHYDSSRVEHTARWRLPVADGAATRDYLDRTLDQTLQIVDDWPASTNPLRSLAYFGWLALVHEDMHGEAAIYMANSLSIALEASRPRAIGTDGSRPHAGSNCLEIPAGVRETGSGDAACAFDNEMPPQRTPLDTYAIDAVPVSNAAFAEFIEAGGYDQPRHWTPAGWVWRERCSPGWPRYWRRSGQRWEQRWFGAWEAIVGEAPVSNVSAHEADAWCRWAGRRLPRELEWECAALAYGPQAGMRGRGAFAWGEVWEWTADAFEPYPGFIPHPYRDYSLPWFGSRRCLRGASFATQARMRYLRYRNFFPAERNDIFAGFRSCPR